MMGKKVSQNDNFAFIKHKSVLFTYSCFYFDK